MNKIIDLLFVIDTSVLGVINYQMNKLLQRTEFIILAVLWIGSISTYTIALLNNYNLFPSDYLGLVGLTIASVVSLSKPNRAIESVLILLFFGLFNLLSFVYFLNLVFTFSINIIVSPGIQLVSLVLLIILVVKKNERVSEIYRFMFGKTEEQIEQTKFSSENRFKSKFEKLTDKQIESKLQDNLIPEAINALLEIKKERSQNI